MQLQPEMPEGHYSLIPAANLFYTRYGIEDGRTPEQAAELAAKFERAFQTAWTEHITPEWRGKILAFWDDKAGHGTMQQMLISPEDAADLLEGKPAGMSTGMEYEGRFREMSPWCHPKIEVLNGWAAFDYEPEITFWSVTQAGLEIRYWTPAVEVLTPRALVSLILEPLGYIATYITKGIGPMKDRDSAAFRIQINEWHDNSAELVNWNESEGRKFRAEWKRVLAMTDGDGLAGL